MARFHSKELPMGVVDSRDIDSTPTGFTWDQACQLALYSDGLIEAQNPGGAQFGESRLLSAMHDTQTGGMRDAVQSALLEHLSGLEAQDDVSLLLVSCPLL
jgi:hypothetical protein